MPQAQRSLFFAFDGSFQNSNRVYTWQVAGRLVDVSEASPPSPDKACLATDDRHAGIYRLNRGEFGDSTR